MEMALAAAEVAKHLPEATVQAIVAEGCDLAREPARDALFRAVAARCREAPRIVRQYVEAVGALS